MSRLSQVFLSDPNWIQRLSARVPRAEFGLEWACGRGALTEFLLQKWDYLLGMELEGEFCRELVEKFSKQQLGIIRTDILKYPLPERKDCYPLVGNLPYHLSGPLLIKILRNCPKINSFRGLLQQEVADRITARPGDKNYSSPGLLFDICGSVKKVYDLPPGAFTPAPGVNSSWIEFTPENTVDNFESLRQLARRLFRYPRKTFLNNLVDNKDNKKKWRKWLRGKNIDPRIRSNKLTPQLFREVYQKWQEK